MYPLINILPHLLPDAEKFVMENDRELYKPFFVATEKFCIENGVLFGGQIGIDLLVGKLITRDSFFWELYSEDPFVTAKRLSQVLFKVKSAHVNPKYVGVRTDLRHREMTILINTRPLIKVYALDKYRGIKLIDLMGPVSRTGYLSGEIIQCVPEEVQLIEIYRTLYSPSKVAKWGEYLEVENKLFDLIADNLKEKATKIVGGVAPTVNRVAVDRILLDKILSNSDNILIGDYAAQALGDEISLSPRIQFISSMRIDDLAIQIERSINKSMPNLSSFGYKLTFIKYSLNIPTDFQITKHTLYINFGTEQTPIADVYNSSMFEMIPYWNMAPPQKIKIGNPWVLLRFRFIDLWILKLISNLDANAAKFLRAKIESLLKALNFLRQLIKQQLGNNPAKLFQLSDYVGIYVNETVAKKKLIKDVGEKFPIYYPAKEFGSSTAPIIADSSVE